MLVAEITVTTGRAFAPTIHRVGYSDLPFAYAEYQRVADLMTAQQERKNDLPKMIELDGGAGKLSCALASIDVIAIVDYAKTNEHMIGTKDAFPLVFKS